MVHRAFLRYLPTSVLRSRGTWLNFQVRRDALAKAKLFPGVNKWDVKINETVRKVTQPSGHQAKNQTNYTKGTVNIGNMSWPTKQECEKYFQLGKNQIQAIKLIPQAVKITFKTSIIPATITTIDNVCHQVMPALLTAIRCNKCQKHGHPTAACRADLVKCPHCAGPHSHSQCRNKTTKKCANCHGAHGAAYKGCPSYSKYITNLASTNQDIMKTHYQNKQNAPAPRVQESRNTMTQKLQIKSIVLAVLKETNQTPPGNLDKIIDEQIKKDENNQINRAELNKNQEVPHQTVTKVKASNQNQTKPSIKRRNTRPGHPLGNMTPLLGYWKNPYPPSDSHVMKPKGWLNNRFSAFY